MQYKSRHEGDLVAKCYFAKRKLVWEVLEGGLKSKIEIQWSDIIGLKAVCPENGPGKLNVVVRSLFVKDSDVDVVIDDLLIIYLDLYCS